MSRNRRSDGDITKARILDAAGNLIAQHGFAQTSNKAIAQAANVDLAAINYHFKGREGLYRAVLVEAHAHYIDEQFLIRLAESPIPPTQKLEVFFQTIIDRLVEKNLWYSNVFIRELFSPNSSLLDFMQNEGMRKFQLIRQIISQASGLDENHPAVLPCVLNVIAPCMMLIISNSNIPTPIAAISQMDTQYLVRHLTTFSMAGLQAIQALSTTEE